jgi:hypothetical protein
LDDSRKRKHGKTLAPNKMTRVDASDPSGRMEGFIVPMRLGTEDDAAANASGGGASSAASRNGDAGGREEGGEGGDVDEEEEEEEEELDRDATRPSDLSSVMR